METHAEKATKALISTEKKFKHALTQKEPDCATIEQRLEKLRVDSGNVALTQRWEGDLKAAESTELKLWDCHNQFNGKFKTLLKTFREKDGQKKHVERRKAEKLYIDFIKASQRFWRGYIQRLDANFTGIPQVHEIAERIAKDNLSAQTQKEISNEQKQSLEKACRNALIRLGDLSRWRETETARKERNWGPAIGFYNLALELDPSAALCYNQLAIINRNDDHHFSAVYYFYRAATTTAPLSIAADSLKVEFGNLVAKMPEESYGLTDTSADDMVSALTKRFLAFHANCYARPYDFVAFQQKASDILGMITLGFEDTKRGPLDEFLQKACIVNICAEYMAKQGTHKPLLTKKMSEQQASQETERSCQSLFLLQRFNMMTFQALLKVLSRELQSDDADAEVQERPVSTVITPTARRVLPLLRQYSSWFLSNAGTLAESKLQSSRRALGQLSKVYAQALNLLKGSIDLFAPNSVGYLLDEDDRTTSFSPFSPVVVKWRHQTSEGSIKPSWRDTGNGKPVEEEIEEMHLRATDLVVDALRFVQHQDDLSIKTVPILLDDEKQFIEKQIPDPERPATPPPTNTVKSTWRSRAHAQGESLNSITDLPSKDATKDEVNKTETPSKSRGQAKQKQPRPVSDIPMPDASPRARSRTNGAKTSPEREQSVAATAPAATNVTTTISSPSFRSSDIETGTPRPASGTYTAMDLVRNMQRGSQGSQAARPSPMLSHKASQGSFPSVFETPLAPPSLGRSSLSPRPRSARGNSPRMSLNGQPPSGAAFQEQLAQAQQEIQNRSSPQPSFETPSSWGTFGKTPTGAGSLLRAFEQKPLTSPSFGTPAQDSDDASQAPKSPVPPFGVIGQPRPTSRGVANGSQG